MTSRWPLRRPLDSVEIDFVDVIGDVHGCRDELDELLERLGYVDAVETARAHPGGRVVVFLGDLTDRGPRNLNCLRLAMSMVSVGAALAVPGNHDVRLEAFLEGQPTDLLHGLSDTVAELQHEPPPFWQDVLAFFRSLPSHVVVDDGRLVVAHAGLPEALHGRESPAIRQLAAWGRETTDIDPTDFAERHPWVATYQGEAAVVFGHTPVAEARWMGRAIDIDTGCVYGGRLTALRWPEREIVSVNARRAYADRGRPLEQGAGDHRIG